MLDITFFLLIIFNEPLLRGYERLLDRYIGVPANGVQPVRESPMAGARRVVILMYALALGGLSLLILPKPISPYLDGLSVYALGATFVALSMLVMIWDRVMCMRGAPVRAISELGLWILFAFVVLGVRVLVLHPRVT